MDTWFSFDDNAQFDDNIILKEPPTFLSTKNSENYEIKLMEEDSSSDDSASSLKKWLFRVQLTSKLKDHENVCVTGDCSMLGNWQFDKCVPLTQESECIWSQIIMLPVRTNSIQFRYCIGVISESNHVMFIRSWEAHIQPRVIEKGSKCNTFIEPHIYGTYDGCNRIDRGWLNNETVIQFKLFNNSLVLWHPKFQNRTLFIKVTPVALDKNSIDKSSIVESMDESLSTDTQDTHDTPKYAYTEVANLNEADCSFQAQQQFGNAYKADDILIFQTSVLLLNNLAFLVDIYANKSKFSEEPPQHIGFSYILPSALLNSESKAIVPVTSVKHRALGQLEIEYLIIKPLTTFNCDMKVSYARHWKNSRHGLDVGHRGLGTSFKSETKNCSEVRENTIASLKTAASHGADFVEFDVQLSKDFIPVVYHDFHVCISLKKKKDLDEMDVLELPVKELTLEQLHCLKIYNLTEGRSKNPKIFGEESEEHQPFPTLQHILEVIDKHVGFNVEIKWNMRLKDGTFELNNPFDVNLYIDTILDVVLKYGGERRIIFSCFNPDICSMIRMKQNKYPVMFLTQGQTDRYPIYHDPRCMSIKSAVQFATSVDILGVNVHTEDLLRDGSQVNLAFRANLVIFCWGEDNNDPATIKYLKQLGLHGVIYDKIDQYKEAKESIFLVEARESRKQFLLLAAANVESLNNHNTDVGLASLSNSNGAALSNMPANVGVTDIQGSLESLTSSE